MWVEVEHEQIVEFPLGLKSNLANLNLKPLKNCRRCLWMVPWATQKQLLQCEGNLNVFMNKTIEVGFNFGDQNLKPHNKNIPYDRKKAANISWKIKQKTP